MSLLAKSITPNQLNRAIYRQPGKPARKSYASKRTNTKPSEVKVFVFHEDGIIKSIKWVKPSKPRYN